MPNKLTQMARLRARARAKAKSICCTRGLLKGRRKWDLAHGGGVGVTWESAGSASVFSSLTLSKPNPPMQMRLSSQRALVNSRNMRTYVSDYLFHEFAAHFTWKINKETILLKVERSFDTLLNKYKQSNIRFTEIRMIPVHVYIYFFILVGFIIQFCNQIELDGMLLITNWIKYHLYPISQSVSKL